MSKTTTDDGRTRADIIDDIADELLEIEALMRLPVLGRYIIPEELADFGCVQSLDRLCSDIVKVRSDLETIIEDAKQDAEDYDTGVTQSEMEASAFHPGD